MKMTDLQIIKYLKNTFNFKTLIKYELTETIKNYILSYFNLSSIKLGKICSQSKFINYSYEKNRINSIQKRTYYLTIIGDAFKSVTETIKDKYNSIKDIITSYNSLQEILKKYSSIDKLIKKYKSVEHIINEYNNITDENNIQDFLIEENQDYIIEDIIQDILQDIINDCVNEDFVNQNNNSLIQNKINQNNLDIFQDIVQNIISDCINKIQDDKVQNISQDEIIEDKIENDIIQDEIIKNDINQDKIIEDKIENDIIQDKKDKIENDINQDKIIEDDKVQDIIAKIIEDKKDIIENNIDEIIKDNKVQDIISKIEDDKIIEDKIISKKDEVNKYDIFTASPRFPTPRFEMPVNLNKNILKHKLNKIDVMIFDWLDLDREMTSSKIHEIYKYVISTITLTNKENYIKYLLKDLMRELTDLKNNPESYTALKYETLVDLDHIKPETYQYCYMRR